MMKRVVLASGNPGKVAEMQSTLSEFGFEVIPQTQLNIADAVEDGLSFVENALIKARHACHHSGLPAIADDSGLEVDALNGAPGIYSARYAEETGTETKDQANNNKLLAALEGEHNRAARFQCVIVYMKHATDPTPLICSGVWQGEIALSEKGNNGFGYDPIFYVPDLTCHSAELSPQQKKLFSHRAKALSRLKTTLNTDHEPNTQ